MRQAPFAGGFFTGDYEGLAVDRDDFACVLRHDARHDPSERRSSAVSARSVHGATGFEPVAPFPSPIASAASRKAAASGFHCHGIDAIGS